MLKVIVDRHLIFVLMGILAAVGIACKCIVNVTLKKLVRAAGNMGKSNHPLMRLVRAKFEHASMVSDRVENVRVFVDKYLYEYKVLGIKLHGWRRMELVTAGLCLLTGIAGAGLEYSVNGMGEMVLRTGAAGAGLAVLLWLIHLITDENYCMEAIQNYMVDYLENVCRHRYEKNAQKEIKVLAQESSQFQQSESGGLEELQMAGREERHSTKESSPQIQELQQTQALWQGVQQSQANWKEPDTQQGQELRTGPDNLHSQDFRTAQDSGQLQKENLLQQGAQQISRQFQAESQQAVQKQVPVKDKRPRRDQAEEDIDRDVVIRRILEEFMA